MSTKRAVRVGMTPTAVGGDSMYWSLGENETAQLTLLADLNEIISVDQYAIWDFKPAPVWVDCGADDPGPELKLKPSYRAFVPVLVSIDGKDEVKLWSVGIGIHRNLHEIGEMSDGLKGLVIKAKRTGAGLKTRYTLVSTGKRVPKLPATIEQDKILEALGPEDRAGIIEMIENRTGMSFGKLKAQMLGEDTTEVDEESF
jgi:hypothetical protein